VSRPTLTIDQALTLLRQTPSRIAEITAALSHAQLHTCPAPDKWSANEVLAHLRSCADVWGDCMRVILAKNTPTIHVVNPRTWIESTNYLDQKFQLSLRAFTAQRTDLLAILEPLPRKSWSRKARITGAGSPLEWTVLIYATRLGVHERAHLKQFKRIAEALRKRQ